jgi:hypothetical protein
MSVRPVIARIDRDLNDEFGNGHVLMFMSPGGRVPAVR